MTDTQCPATTVTPSGVARCAADAGHRPGHYLIDEWEECTWHWLDGQAPRQVTR